MTKSIIFSIGESHFGIPISQVGRLSKVGKIEPLPDAPDWIDGLIVYRDKPLPYIKFWEILDLKPPEKQILLLPYEFDYCAFGISEISGIFELNIKEKNKKILPIPYITGFGELDEKIVILINLSELLSKKQRKIIDKLNKKHAKK